MPCFNKTKSNKTDNLGSDFFYVKIKTFIALKELLYD